MTESHEEIVVNDLALAANFHILAANVSGQVEAIAHRIFHFTGCSSTRRSRESSG